jgi:hypothetical protein
MLVEAERIAEIKLMADAAARGRLVVVPVPEDVAAVKSLGATGWYWHSPGSEERGLETFRARSVTVWAPTGPERAARALKAAQVLQAAGAQVRVVEGRGNPDTVTEHARRRHNLADVGDVGLEELARRAGTHLNGASRNGHTPVGKVKAVVEERPHASQDEDDGHRQVSLTPASAIKIRPVRWLWTDRIALGTLALLGGREGIGKSTLSYQLAADLTRGRLDGTYAGQAKPVIVAATEDSWEHTIVPRLMGAGADLDLVYRVDVTTSAGYAGQLTLPSDLGALRACVGQVDAGMVLLDPLISRLDAKLDTHKDAEVRQALEPLVALADRCNIALLGLIHLNKSLSTDPLTMLMASRAFAAVARGVLFVTVDPEDESVRILGQPKNNLGRTDLPALTFTIQGETVAETEEGPVRTGRLLWLGESERTLNDVLRSAAESNETRTATAEAAAWLADYLAIHRVASSQQIKTDAKTEGHGPDALKRARNKIGAGAINHGFPRRSYWSHPDMTPDQVEDHLQTHAQSEQNSQSNPGESAPTALTAPTGQKEDPVGAVGAVGAVSRTHAPTGDTK